MSKSMAEDSRYKIIENVGQARFYLVTLMSTPVPDDYFFRGMLPPEIAIRPHLAAQSGNTRGLNLEEEIANHIGVARWMIGQEYGNPLSSHYLDFGLVPPTWMPIKLFHKTKPDHVPSGGRVEDLSLVTPSKIKEYRESNGMNMEAFGKKAGVNRATVSRWESCESITRQSAALILYVYPDFFSEG